MQANAQCSKSSARLRCEIGNDREVALIYTKSAAPLRRSPSRAKSPPSPAPFRVLHVASELARQRPGRRVLFTSGYSKDILDVKGESADGQLSQSLTIACSLPSPCAPRWAGRRNSDATSAALPPPSREASPHQ